MNSKTLNGSQRVVVDGVLSAEECRELQRLTNVSAGTGGAGRDGAGDAEGSHPAARKSDRLTPIGFCRQLPRPGTAIVGRRLLTPPARPSTA